MRVKVRIGIDVGGTFTDAVVINNHNGDILAKKKVPTTHTSDKGVAAGITEIVSMLLAELCLEVEDVVFIAHGTTQATNALLEGDVAKVGILGFGTSKTAKRELNVGNIELAANKYLYTNYQYLDVSQATTQIIEKKINDLLTAGSEVIVVSQEYAVDDPSLEILTAEICERLGVVCTMAHAISELYGLKVRTRTAVVNASLIPKMLETAEMTELVVKNLGIASELMIMRADGGVMSVSEMKHRPILTMLSGLAAGVAGALIYEKVTDGIFLEAGGTSTDISLIKSGEVIINNAVVGNHKTYMKALDVRTLAIAGGSMIRIKNKKIIDVGPRSAHLAGVEYECFTTNDLTDYRVELISPCAGDSDDYTILSNGKDSYSYTLAGASNHLKFVPESDYAYANQEDNDIAWQVLGNYLGISSEAAANQVVAIAMSKVDRIVQDLIREYEVDDTFLELIGGGGSAAVVTYPLGAFNGIKSKVADNAPYISTIGVALAMLREQIERSVINPTNDDIIKIRNDVTEKIIKSGAKIETIKVDVSIDSQKNIVLATATAASEYTDVNSSEVSEQDQIIKIAEGFNIPQENIQRKFTSGFYDLFQVKVIESKLFGIMKKKKEVSVVVNKNNVIKLKSTNCNAYQYNKSELLTNLEQIVESNSTYSDAGQTLPSIFVFTNSKDLNYSGLINKQQIYDLIRIDLEGIDGSKKLILVAEGK